MKKHFAACLLLTPVLVWGQVPKQTSITQPSSDARGPLSGPDVSNYVSTDLDSGEQAFMRTYINALSSDARTRILNSAPEDVYVAIIDGATGKIHYNRPEIAGSLEMRSDLPLPSDPHPSLQGAESAAREPSANPGLFGGSGPYRRVYTPSLPAIPVPSDPHPGIEAWGNYGQSGWVTTPLKDGSFGVGDVGYMYLGGWSGNWNTVKGSQAISSVVDAGLQYSPTYDDYAMFINVGGGKPAIGIIHKGNSPDSKQPFRIAGGAMTHVFFNVITPVMAIDAPSQCLFNGTTPQFFGPSPACTTFILQLETTSAHVEGKSGDVEQFIAWVAPSVDTGGWAISYKFVGSWNGKPNQTLYASKAPCGGCIFKWMTSIGQKPKENLTDGASFNATWSDREITKFAYGDTGAEGQKLALLTADLTLCSEYPLWKPPYGPPYFADCKNTPSGLKGIAQSVNVTNYSTTGETDTISLKY
jgi:hypothetical protein